MGKRETSEGGSPWKPSRCVVKGNTFHLERGASSHPCAPACETRLDLRNQTNRTASGWRRRRQELRRPQRRALPPEPPDPSLLEEDRPGRECSRSESTGCTELRGKDHGMLSREDVHSGLSQGPSRQKPCSLCSQTAPAHHQPSTTADTLHQRDTEFSQDPPPRPKPGLRTQEPTCASNHGPRHVRQALTSQSRVLPDSQHLKKDVLGDTPAAHPVPWWLGW